MNNNTIKENKRQVDLIEKYAEKKKLMRSNQVFRNIASSDISKKTHERMLICSNWVSVVSDMKMEKKKIAKSNCCGNRFCAVCAWRTARKEAVIVSVLMEYVAKKRSKKFIFLTLTAPNVKKEDLKNQIDKFNHAFSKLFRRKKVIDINQGYVRKLEITYNKNQYITKNYYKKCKEYCDRNGLRVGDENPNYDTYHPHIHVIIAVNSSYFKQKTYIKHGDWLEMWRKSMNDDSITQIDIRKVEDLAGDGKKDNIIINKKKTNVAFEVAKYTAKDTDMHLNEDVFDSYYKALKGRQLITYNGLFKEVVKYYKEYLKIKDIAERRKHFLHKHMPEDPNQYIYKILYQWGHGEYVEKEKKLLTEQEKKEFNQMIVEEMEEEKI